MPSTRRSILAACTAGVGALAGCTSTEKPTAVGSWPRRTRNNAHTGYATTAGPTMDLHAVWHRELPHHFVVTSPVVDDGTLYYARESERSHVDKVWVEAFDAVTGDVRWTTEIVGPDPSSGFCSGADFCNSDSLVVDGDRLFHQTRAGLAMLTTDGDVQWTVDPPHQRAPEAAAPVVTDDLVVTGGYAAVLEAVYGIDPGTGDERWRTQISEWTDMLPLTGTGDAVYVPFREEGIVALDLTTGEERWRWAGPVAGTPTVVDDLLLAPLSHRYEDGIAALDRSDRSVRWQVSIGSRATAAGLSVAHGRVYHAADWGIEARRLETGERLWRFGGDRDDRDEPGRGVPQLFIMSTPVVSGDAVYAPGWIPRDSAHGQLFVIDAATGEELDRVAVDGISHHTIPAVTSDLVFLAADHGNLYAFGECSFEVAGRCLRG